MEEKYNTLSLVQLREIVKAQGIKNTSTMRKAQLVKILCDLEEKANEEKARSEAPAEEKKGAQRQEETELAREDRTREDRTREDRYNSEWEREDRTRDDHYNYEREREDRTRDDQYNYDRERADRTREDRYNSDRERADRTRDDHYNYEREREDRTREDRTREDRYNSERERADRTREDRYNSERERADRTRDDRYNSDRERTDRTREDRYNSERERADRTRDDRYNYDRERMDKTREGLDSGEMAHGILEVMSDGFGFIRCENYLPGENDIYVSPAQIRRFNLRTGDIIEGNIKIKSPTEKFSALLYVQRVNGFLPGEAAKRKKFEDMTPIFPNSRIRLENVRSTIPMRIVDLVSPIGKGQRGMIVSPPKTGKTTLLKQIAKSITYNHPEMNMIILLIDERPEEVTDIKEYIEGNNVEVIYSTFDELPEHHKRVAEMVLERAKRLVEHKKDVVILLDSITRLARAYNLTVPPSGRTLSGGLDPAALHMPKRFFGAARNMREGGSLTVLATALVETGSKMDDVVFEEFKGTGNMELVLDRKLSEKRIFPAIDIPRSGTRREELLLDKEELDAMYIMRKALSGMKQDEALEHILDMFMRTRTNREFIANIKRTKII